MNIISTYQQYNDFVTMGFEPLVDWRRFELEINLRVQIQRNIFGHRELTKGDIRASNDRFYRWCFDHSRQVCEETGQPIYEYSSVNVSHIITKGSHPEIAHDPRNINILIFTKHNRWESGNCKGMKIYSLNMLIIELLKKEYSQLK